MKKYILPSITILSLLLGIVIGFVVSPHAEAQPTNWSRLLMPQSKVDQMLQMMQMGYVDEIDVDSITEVVMSELDRKSVV